MRNGVLENLGAWKLFIRVAGFRSFRSAAKALDEDPSVVSRRIAQLESALGFRLFDTSGQTLVLTENGRRALRTIAPLLDIADKTLADIREGVVRPKRQLHRHRARAGSHIPDDRIRRKAQLFHGQSPYLALGHRSLSPDKFLIRDTAWNRIAKIRIFNQRHAEAVEALFS